MFIENFTSLFNSVVPFLVILTILVFVHELGHYLIARYNGVKVEVFSIGFGRELFGFNDTNGTRWKFSLIPLGGYVKMHGDEDAASSKKKDSSKVDQKLSFHSKSVGQRSAILFAGPAANYIFSFLLLIIINFLYGSPTIKPIISELIDGGSAIKSGLQKDDLILSINDEEVESFENLKKKILKFNDKIIKVTVSRNDKIYDYDVLVSENKIGIKGLNDELVKLGFIDSLKYASNQIYFFTTTTLIGISEIFVGKRGSDELGGPIRIAELSSDFWSKGVHSTLWFMVLISLNLGLINLFPIPLLDGGHLLFNFIEFVKGSPVEQKTMELFQSIGFFTLISLMLYATYNDISRFL